MFQMLTQVGLPLSLIFITIGVGLSLTFSDFNRVFQQPKAFIVGATCQLVALPLIAVAVIHLTGLSGELAIGLFILALCPGGATSNLFSYLARADVGLSVSLTTMIGFLTPFSIPVLGAWAISFYGVGLEQGDFQLPIFTTWIKLMVVTVFPVMVGMWIRRKWPEAARLAEPYISRFSVAVLLIVVVAIGINLGDRVVDYVVQAGPAAIALNLLTMVFGYAVAKWLLHDEAQTRTITLEIGLQNGTMALLVTLGVLQSSPMSIAPSIYGLFMFFSAGLFTLLVLKKDRLAAPEVVSG